MKKRRSSPSCLRAEEQRKAALARADLLKEHLSVLTAHGPLRQHQAEPELIAVHAGKRPEERSFLDHQWCSATTAYLEVHVLLRTDLAQSHFDDDFSPLGGEECVRTGRDPFQGLADLPPVQLQCRQGRMADHSCLPSRSLPFPCDFPHDVLHHIRQVLGRETRFGEETYSPSSRNTSPTYSISRAIL